MTTKFQLKNQSLLCVNMSAGCFDDVIVRGKKINCGKVGLFAVKLRRHDGNGVIVSVDDCVFMGFDGKTATYFNDNVDIAVHFCVSPDGGALLLRADVSNKTDLLVEWVELMSVCVGGKLRDEQGGTGAIVYPFNEGGLVTNMAFRESMPYRYDEPRYPSKSGYSIFPNMICSQFLAYVSQNCGLYLGMHDVERTTKHIDFCYRGNDIKLQMRTFCNADYGQDYSMPFDCVIQPFVGDWQDACEIYRDWFENNLPAGLTKIVANKDLPDWYHKSPVTVIYPVRGRKDTGDMTPNGMYPYVNGLSFLQEVATATNSPVMALLMHWEGTAPWAPPYVWQPFGGEKKFGDFLQQAHDKHMLVGLYMSGMGYTLKSNVLPDYDRTTDFERDNIADIVCTDSNDDKRSIICPQQRVGYDLCPACDKSKQIMSDEIGKLCKFGVDYVQALDQNHGGVSYFCFSDKHGHVPAPGKWQAEETCKMLDRVHTYGALLGCESAASEPMIAHLPYSDSRFQLNLYVGTPIPVYSYIYHEYVNNFMGNQVCAMLNKVEESYTYRLAYSFTAGDMLSLVTLGDGKVEYSWDDWIAPRDKTVDKQVAFGFIRTLNGWRQGKSGKYLHLGRMTKPVRVTCGKQHFTLDDGSDYTPDEVLTTAYTLDGETLQFVVNYNRYEVTVKLPQTLGGYLDNNLTEQFDPTDTMTIAPLSVVALKLDDSAKKL